MAGPDHWTPEEVLEDIRSAFANSVVGVDGNPAKWRAGEANSAIRYEQQYGGRLTRYENGGFDFQQGTTTFDVKGAVDPSQAKAFAARFNPRSFVDGISKYLKRSQVDFVIVELLYVPDGQKAVVEVLINELPADQKRRIRILR
jgi:hypothetical protein